MEEAAELFKQFLLTLDSFRKLQNEPASVPVNAAAFPEISEYELVAPNIGRVSIPGQDAFMTPTSFRPEADFRSTKPWDSRSGSETVVTEGTVRRGSSMVAESGTGSLPVTGPNGAVNGARTEYQL